MLLSCNKECDPWYDAEGKDCVEMREKFMGNWQGYWLRKTTADTLGLDTITIGQSSTISSMTVSSSVVDLTYLGGIGNLTNTIEFELSEVGGDFLGNPLYIYAWGIIGDEQILIQRYWSLAPITGRDSAVVKNSIYFIGQKQ